MSKENHGRKHSESKVDRQKRLKRRSEKDIAERENEVKRVIKNDG